MTKCFVDTNVLAYAKDRKNSLKQAKAKLWLESLAARRSLVLSAQSLREYYAVSLRLVRPLDCRADARREIASLASFVPESLLEDRLVEAWALEDRYRLAFFDCLLIASALAAGCEIFLSEDMNGGQKIDALRIVNPFATSPEAVLGA